MNVRFDLMLRAKTTLGLGNLRYTLPSALAHDNVHLMKHPSATVPEHERMTTIRGEPGKSCGSGIVAAAQACDGLNGPAPKAGG